MNIGKPFIMIKKVNVRSLIVFGNSPIFYGLLGYIEKTATSWEYNSVQLQSIFSTLCGYYCIYFVLLKSRNIEMFEILNLFNKTNFNINDYIVSNIFP